MIGWQNITVTVNRVTFKKYSEYDATLPFQAIAWEIA